MADRFPHDIIIGGPIPRAMIPELADQLNNVSAYQDWDGGEWEPEDIERCAGGLLEAKNCESSGFEFLEEWLREHNIAYTRHNDAKYEYDAMIVEFRPGMPPDNPREFYSTNNAADRLVACEDIKRLLESAGPAAATAHGLGVFMAQLRHLIGDDIPELKPVTIVDEPAPVTGRPPVTIVDLLAALRAVDDEHDHIPAGSFDEPAWLEEVRRVITETEIGGAS